MATEQGPSKPLGVHESTALLRLILRISQDFEFHLGDELTVNATDLSAMRYLITEGAMSPSQLAKRLRLSTAATTAVADRLTRAGHVTRAPHPTDRRGIIIQPAPESVAKAMVTLTPMITGIDQVIREFTEPEQDAITRYLRRVVEVYRDGLPAGPGETG